MDKITKGTWLKRASFLFFFSIIALLLNCFDLAKADTTKTVTSAASQKPPIKIGISLDLSTEVKANRAPMKLGVELYFARINAAGGIQGRKLELISMDDAYDPVRAAANTRQMIDNDQVLALLGSVGSANTVTVVPIVNEKKVLLFGARSGAGTLRKTPPDRYVINFRASNAEEMIMLVKGLMSIGIKPDEFAFFTQNDTYGDSFYQGAMKAIKTVGYPDPEKLPYGRHYYNVANVEGALGQILSEAKTPPKVIFSGGSAVANSDFVKLAISTYYPNALYVTVSSFIDLNKLDKKEEGKVISSQIVPSPDADLPAIREFLEDLQKYGKGEKASYFALEGYLAAKLFVMGLQQAALENKLTREGIIDVFENMRDVDMGIGVKINLDKNNHQALHTVWVTVFRNGKFVPMEWNELRPTIQHK